MENKKASKPYSRRPHPHQHKFSGAAGSILSAKLAPAPFKRDNVLENKNAKPAFKRGIVYENKAQRYLRELAGAKYIRSPGITFVSKEAPGGRWCEPDGVIVDRDASRITIIEIKYTHTALAWDQIRLLYDPLIRFIFGNGFQYANLEICRWLDPHVYFPETFSYIKDPLEVPPDVFGVHIYNPRFAPSRS